MRDDKGPRAERQKLSHDELGAIFGPFVPIEVFGFLASTDLPMVDVRIRLRRMAEQYRKSATQPTIDRLAELGFRVACDDQDIKIEWQDANEYVRQSWLKIAETIRDAILSAEPVGFVEKGYSQKLAQFGVASLFAKANPGDVPIYAVLPAPSREDIDHGTRS